jgi:hypothetical protein
MEKYGTYKIYNISNQITPEEKMNGWAKEELKKSV